MSIKDTIKNDVKESMKAGDSFTTGILRLMLAASAQKEMDKRYKLAKDNPSAAEEALLKDSQLSDDEMMTVLASEVKKRRDAIALYEQGGRPELAESEQKEIGIIQKYLPEQLPPEELKKLVAEAIKTTGAASVKDTGKIMTELAPKTKGRAENAEISKIIKELLS